MCVLFATDILVPSATDNTYISATDNTYISATDVTNMSVADSSFDVKKKRVIHQLLYAKPHFYFTVQENENELYIKYNIQPWDDPSQIHIQFDEYFSYLYDETPGYVTDTYDPTFDQTHTPGYVADTIQ